MAIEGPLRELGIHDVFQLLDLSRKTGTLRVTSELRDNEGTVYFENGKVLFAAVRSNPHPLGQLLVRAGKISQADLERASAVQSQQADGRRMGEILLDMGLITPRELERQVRLQVETVVFELMSWREGFFSFEERDVSHAPAEATARISTESLLMEGARRIDEWSRIAGRVPHLGVIPVLAEVDEDHPTLLDLLPKEWEVLGAIDGGADLRTIASSLNRTEFDVAKVVYGLLSTGAVVLRDDVDAPPMQDAPPGDDAGPFVARAESAFAAGDYETALSAARRAAAAEPGRTDARLVAARALGRLGRHADAAEELRRAAQADPHHALVQRELGYAAARRGDLDGALAAWAVFAASDAARTDATDEAARVRRATNAAHQLRAAIAEHDGV